jgi:hypothetical protein
MGGAYAEAPELVHLRVDEIRANPRQPRRHLDHEATSGLADSIRAQGVLSRSSSGRARAAATS